MCPCIKLKTGVKKPNEKKYRMFLGSRAEANHTLTQKPVKSEPEAVVGRVKPTYFFNHNLKVSCLLHCNATKICLYLFF